MCLVSSRLRVTEKLVYLKANAEVIIFRTNIALEMMCTLVKFSEAVNAAVLQLRYVLQN